MKRIKDINLNIKGDDGAVQNLISVMIYGIFKPICFFAGP